MSFTVIDVPQRSPEWFTARAGRATGSRAKDILASIKSGEAAARRNYRVQLVLERITGKPHEGGYVSTAMQQGIEREADAAALYEALTGRVLQTTGFLQHGELMAGCSLDGHVGDFEGLIEAKCPLPATHLDYLTTGKVPRDYLAQITHALWMVPSAPWCDWLSYCPDFPEPLQTKLVRVNRADVDLAAYELALSLFLSEVEKEESRVRQMLKEAA